ncbi:MAG TPA: hypothetical protein EYP04_05000, partial [Anaerolineae bacterium]|nr:hypothetical protein [Anaerolineae bacterium]
MIQSTHFRRLFSIALILGLVLTLINSSLAFAQPPRPGGENPAKTRSWGDGSRRAPIQNEKTDPLVRTERNDKSYTPLGTCHVSPTATGGPDEFGYTYIDSNEAGGPTFNWVDISGTGTAVALGDDDGDGPFPIGFTFNFYGIDYTEFYIASNGYLPMDGDDLTDFGNDCPVNDTLDPNSTIAVVWDDLVMSDGMAYYQVFDPCPVGAGACLVVEWDDARHFGTSDYFDFEAILYDNGDILMQFGPGNPELGEGSTTGIESYWPDGYATTYGLTYSCDTTNGLSDNLAVLFQYPTPPNPFPPPPPAPPDNDDCNTPTVIPDDGPFPYYPPVIDSSTATVAPDDPDMGCGGGVNQNTVWYEFTPPTDGYLSVHTFSSDYDTVLAIFDATPGCGALGPALACSDDVGFFLQSAIWDLPVTGGTTYLIEVADYGTIPGGGDTQPYFAFSPVPGAIGSHSSTTTHKFNPDNQAGFVGGNSRFDAIDGVNQLYWNWIAFRFGGSGGRIDIGGAGDLIQLANVALNDPTSVPGFRENTYTAYTAPGYIVYQRTFSNDTADGDDWAIVELTIKNVGSTALTDGRVFVYLDWDARGDSDFDTSGFEPETNLNYQEDGYLRGYVAGIAPVTPGFVGYGADYWPGPGTYVAVGAEMDAPSNNTIGAAGDVVTWEVFQVPTIPPGSSVKLAYVLTTGYSPSADMDAALKNAQAQVKTAVNTYRPGFSGWVFHDENGNGVRDPGEAGIPGALVTN